ncbi:hypothetical protein BGW36DRAFT_1118 [Talaromyces proteolyticus]|uniref:Thiolase-like protein type 1 additional C-terminal domain-containing protein n=1 Tax=Talaromyces proteolyticus TaxID=1131652 RepID=A0AAD4Q0Q8_9EURO|nr:uncharacterized protein BGW36DRAFT_1118 [Talaromyces proteolyticus]KAH8704740.1 hypothetical protein BGW36DRAFT_1118 [Talaromyces proteolyticus]
MSSAMLRAGPNPPPHSYRVMPLVQDLTPVIVGVGDIKNASTKVEDAREPAELMLDAIHQALHDTGLNSVEELRSQIDSIDVVRTWTWAYGDLPGLLAEKLNVGQPPKHHSYTENGGNQPAKIMDEAARRISRGESTVALITGGEALASLAACSKTGHYPPPGWTAPDENFEIFSPSERRHRNIYSMGAPIHIYPLYENGFRAHRGQSASKNNEESARLYAEFSHVASENPIAWNYGKAYDAKTIGNTSKTNRMICYPYPLLMNAFNMVNMAAACLLTSVDHARKLGIPEKKWIYALGGAGTKESDIFWERPNYFSSPAVSRSIDEALLVSGLNADAVDIFDFYSCFPIVPKLACRHLNLDPSNPSKPITVLGGLTSFGGAGNNYSMHAITNLVRRLRNPSGKEKVALVLANGGVLSYQHVVCLSANPRSDGRFYPQKNPLPEKITDVPIPTIVEVAEGEAVIETYTIEYNRDGSPNEGYIIGRLKSNNSRFISITADKQNLQQLVTLASSDEPIGKTGFVYVEDRPEIDQSERRNLFTFSRKRHIGSTRL